MRQQWLRLKSISVASWKFLSLTEAANMLWMDDRMTDSYNGSTSNRLVVRTSSLADSVGVCLFEGGPGAKKHISSSFAFKGK